MQEVLLVTNRRSQLRVTPLGGGVAGLFIGLVLASGLNYYLAKPMINAIGIASSSQLMGANQVSSKDGIGTEGCDAILNVINKDISDIEKIKFDLDRFPFFKSEPYISVFNDLSHSIDAKLASSNRLYDKYRRVDCKVN